MYGTLYCFYDTCIVRVSYTCPCDTCTMHCTVHCITLIHVYFVYHTVFDFDTSCGAEVVQRQSPDTCTLHVSVHVSRRSTCTVQNSGTNACTVLVFRAYSSCIVLLPSPCMCSVHSVSSLSCARKCPSLVGRFLRLGAPREVSQWPKSTFLQ